MGPHDLIVRGLFKNERSTVIIVLVSHTDDASKASAEINSIEARGRSIEAHHDFVSIDAHGMPGRLAAVQKEGGRAWEVERAAVWRWLTCADVREL